MHSARTFEDLIRQVRERQKCKKVALLVTVSNISHPLPSPPPPSPPLPSRILVKQATSSVSPGSQHEESPAREQPVGSRGETPGLEVLPEDEHGGRRILPHTALPAASIPRPEEVPPPWICLYSTRARRPFFYNPQTRIGTFLWPLGGREEEEKGGHSSEIVARSEGGEGGERSKRKAEEVGTSCEISDACWGGNKKKKEVVEGDEKESRIDRGEQRGCSTERHDAVGEEGAQVREASACISLNADRDVREEEGDGAEEEGRARQEISHEVSGEVEVISDSEAEN
eukprot:763573-Hanusia_phi.AAC.6